MAGALAQAQGVYVIQGPNGPVFSNTPQPGAKELSLRPLNVVPPTKEPKVSPVPAKPEPETAVDGADAAPPLYQSFSIVFPENNGSIVANTAVFDVRVAVDPALKLGEGHAFEISVNGRPVGQRFTATEFMVPPEFWGDTLPPPNQTVQLDASIVDASGRLLKAAAPVRFTLRYATVLNHPKRPRPLVPPKAHPEPEPTKHREPASAVMLKQADQ
jgi:hypothetical protein